MQVEFKYKNKDSSRRDRAAEQLFTCNVASSKRSSTDSFSKPNFATLRVLPLHCSSARRSVSSAPRTCRSACLLARRDVRAPLLSDATTAISCFGGSGATQRLLQRTSTGTGEPSSKRHPVHCAKCHFPNVTWQKCKCNIPDDENLHADSMYPSGSFHCAALFSPATAAVCLDKTFWYSKLTAWISLWHTGRSTLSCAHKTAYVRARTQWRWTQNTVTLPSPFQVSPLWRSGGWVQEDDSNPQRLLLVRPGTSICRALQIPSRPRRLPKASLWSVNQDWQRHDAGRQTV